ncbi:hypothetical protein Pen01_14380 [Phytomonospora endophytica]|nr:hypothetical protein Pen01_14380 [Phytomonospora endophytica]
MEALDRAADLGKGVAAASGLALLDGAQLLDHREGEAEVEHGDAGDQDEAGGKDNGHDDSSQKSRWDGRAVPPGGF